MTSSTVTITRTRNHDADNDFAVSDQFVVTFHARWDQDPGVFRSNDPHATLEMVQAVLCPGGWVVETFEDEHGDVWHKQPRPV